MRELIRSMVHLSVAMPMLAMKQAADLWKKSGTTESLTQGLDSVSRAAEGQLDGVTKDVYDGGVRLEREVFGETRPGPASEPDEADEAAAQPARREDEVDSGDLDTRTIVVLGEGLAAGFGDFTLAEEFQRESFPAQMAAQMRRELSQPALESPGIGEAPGFERLPTIVPALMQTSVLTDIGRPSVPHNLAVPCFRVSDASGLRPVQPVIHQEDVRQTLANLILGPPELLQGGATVSQLERAVALQPTFAIVELGYFEVLEATSGGRLTDLPDPVVFRDDYQRLVADLRKTGAHLLLLTIPNPLDTAYFSSIDVAARSLRVTPALLTEAYELANDDLISIPALLEMGYQLLSDSIGSLPAGGILKGADAARARERVAELNAAIGAIAEEHDAEVFDLAGLFAGVADRGVQVGERTLTADFLGGFYLLNGYYPGTTGHALIANAILDQLSRSQGASFERIDLEQAMGRDPAAGQRPAGGPVLKSTDLRRTSAGVTEVGTRRLETRGSAAKRSSQRSAKGKAPSTGTRAAQQGRLQLPPGLEQTLPLSSAASYFGDAIRAAHCRDEDEQVFGSGRELLFGGLAMVDSHLSGEIRIQFSQPTDGLTHFEVRVGRLEGEDGKLQAPQFFKLPVRRNEVRDDDELVSQGDLNLDTGEVTNLKFAVRFGNTALMALVRVNPKLPNVPIEFPGLYGSAWARFEQRDDGLLDFSFYGTTFIPLGGAMFGDPVRFPLPLCGPTLEFASILAPGTSLHPHLCLSTREPEPADPALVPEIPVNTLREYTIYTHNTAFGDKFTLNSPELAGDPTGRSQLLGRVQVQFGAPSGDSVPVAISCLNPGGMLAEAMPNPLADMFPGRLPQSPIGHNEFLRFATRTYYLDSLTCIDDPFDVSVGNVSRSTGRFLSDLLHRALIGQNLFYALIRVEPRTPKSSFYFRGPANFEKGADGRTVFRFSGLVKVPYPEGYLFPSPDMALGVPIGPDSVLDPFYWIQAMEHERSTGAMLSGEAEKLLSSANELFSYKYEISGDRARESSFEYTNHAAGGVFRLKSLAWVSFVNSRGAGSAGDGYDTVSFAGFGTWSRDESSAMHLVCAQISEASDAPYVSIQVGGGRLSNVNTKPPNLDDVRP